MAGSTRSRLTAWRANQSEIGTDVKHSNRSNEEGLYQQRLEADSTGFTSQIFPARTFTTQDSNVLDEKRILLHD